MVSLRWPVVKGKGESITSLAVPCVWRDKARYKSSSEKNKVQYKSGCTLYKKRNLVVRTIGRNT